MRPRFVLKALVVVAYVVESFDQDQVGKEIDDAQLKVPVFSGTCVEKEFQVSVCRIVYQRSASTLLVSGKKPDLKTQA